MNQLKEQIAKVAENVNIVALAVSKIGLTTRNRWDIAACHEDLSLIGPERLIVHYTGAFNGYRSVFAVEPIRKLDFGICYYEVKILKKNDIVCIGLATKQTPLLGPFRDHEGTFGRDNGGGNFKAAHRAPKLGLTYRHKSLGMANCRVNNATTTKFGTPQQQQKQQLFRAFTGGALNMAPAHPKLSQTDDNHRHHMLLSGEVNVQLKKVEAGVMNTMHGMTDLLCLIGRM
uniref:Uncharacterized protein n=1 Tax=Globodera pallida TaxID=36090 RepID=A0A183CR42_GLOPA